MPVADYCRHQPYTAQAGSSAREVALRMKQVGVGPLIVVDGALPVGMLTDRDISLKVLCGRLDPDVVQVGELMEAPPVCVRENTPLAEAQRRVRIRQTRRELRERLSEGFDQLGEVGAEAKEALIKELDAVKD